MLDGECVRDCSGYPGEAIVLRFCAGVIAESPTPCDSMGARPNRLKYISLFICLYFFPVFFCYVKHTETFSLLLI